MSKIAVMTGATSGFGRVVAQHLVQQSYTLVFLARSKDKAIEFKEFLQTKNQGAIVEFILCDLSSMQSILDACEEIHAKCSRIDLLILNAGLWNFDFRETKDGIEETFQVNLLAPVLILQKTKDLIPLSNGAKVILTASGLHQGKIQFDNLEFRNDFSGFKSYRHSKLGVILMTRLFAELPDFSGISFYSVHPGVVKTNLGKNANWFSRFIFRLMGTSVQKGAKTHIALIDKPAGNLSSGEYYAKSQITKTTSEAYDLKEAKKLFDVIGNYLKPFLEKK